MSYGGSCCYRFELIAGGELRSVRKQNRELLANQKFKQLTIFLCWLVIVHVAGKTKSSKQIWLLEESSVPNSGRSRFALLEEKNNGLLYHSD